MMCSSADADVAFNSATCAGNVGSIADAPNSMRDAFWSVQIRSLIGVQQRMRLMGFPWLARNVSSKWRMSLGTSMTVSTEDDGLLFANLLVARNVPTGSESSSSNARIVGFELALAANVIAFE